MTKMWKETAEVISEKKCTLTLADAGSQSKFRVDLEDGGQILHAHFEREEFIDHLCTFLNEQGYSTCKQSDFARKHMILLGRGLALDEIMKLADGKKKGALKKILKIAENCE